eukprot:GHVS01038638.1.p1 GENE.GHVS01038638.1~~GHVS01038638.1.p1  ORF type:complete len:505 (+),score=135.96 GHVS01038638.1:841-2355(+)
MRDPIHPEESNPTDKEYLFVDYSVDYNDICPATPNDEINGNISGMSSIYPVSSVVDLNVVVGYTEDGGQIMLGKTLFRNIASFPHDGDITVAWWFVVNYDEESFPTSLLPGQPIGPIATSFNYRYQGLFDHDGLVSYFLGIGGFIRNPFAAFQRLLYFSLLRPVGGLPAMPDSDVEKLVLEWPTAGIPLPEYALEAIAGPSGHLPKSGRVPAYGTTVLGSPLAALESFGSLAQMFIDPLQNPIQIKLGRNLQQQEQHVAAVHTGEMHNRSSLDSFAIPSPPALLLRRSREAASTIPTTNNNNNNNINNNINRNNNNINNSNIGDEHPLVSKLSPRPGSSLLDTGGAMLTNIPGGADIVDIPKLVSAGLEAALGIGDNNNSDVGGVGTGDAIAATTAAARNQLVDLLESIPALATEILGLPPLRGVAAPGTSDLTKGFAEAAVSAVGSTPVGAAFIRAPDVALSQFAQGLHAVIENLQQTITAGGEEGGESGTDATTQQQQVDNN